MQKMTTLELLKARVRAIADELIVVVETIEILERAEKLEKEQGKNPATPPQNEV